MGAELPGSGLTVRWWLAMLYLPAAESGAFAESTGV